MKRAGLIFIGAVISLSGTGTSFAQQPATQDSPVTLYSVIKHAGETLKYSVTFKVPSDKPLRGDGDLRYGSMYAGDDLDWFQSSFTEGNRSVIRDLGEHDWSTWFEVPVVEPLARLKPGEQRRISVDTSGADGADGAPGSPGAPGKPGADGDGVVRALPISVAELPRVIPATAARPKRDGKPKIDPAFVKAIVGHVYVIHVVDDTRDFYALFRVEELQRGDYCTVSWKLIPEPINQPGSNALR
ncbi:MAG: hypothetical protein QOH71_4387 [Blastocatellia bacterium]|jgi:hypothetical protein|nr:hypothetical protein [Blastocatellia bacterium]